MYQDLVAAVGSELLKVSVIAGFVSAAISSIAALLGKRYLERKLERERSRNAENLERLKAEYGRDLEAHRARVRFTEMYFQRQFEACDAIFALLQGMLPSYVFPDMDWSDAVERMADDMERVEKEAQDLYTKYYAVLPDEVVKHLTGAAAAAGTAKFEVENGAVSEYGREMVERVYESLREASTSLKGILDGQRHSLVQPSLEQQLAKKA